MSEGRREPSARRLRYSVAMSLDGFIADPEGGYDWIVDEQEIDFPAYLAKIDTLLMGRGTYEIMLEAPGGLDAYSAMDIHVVSTTLDPADHPEVEIIDSDVAARVRALKLKESTAGAPIKDIWLFGGGVLFRTLLEAGLVDRVEVGVVPVLLGEGIPLLPGLEDGSSWAALELHSLEAFDSGIVLLKYDVRPS